MRKLFYMCALVVVLVTSTGCGTTLGGAFTAGNTVLFDGTFSILSNKHEFVVRASVPEGFAARPMLVTGFGTLAYKQVKEDPHLYIIRPGFRVDEADLVVEFVDLKTRRVVCAADREIHTRRRGDRGEYILAYLRLDEDGDRHRCDLDFNL